MITAEDYELPEPTGNFLACPICNTFYWTNGKQAHQCPPRFLVCLAEENFGDRESVYANDHKDAALKFVRQYDATSDANIAHDAETVEVKVVLASESEDSEKVQTFVIAGEYVPEYWVERL